MAHFSLPPEKLDLAEKLFFGALLGTLVYRIIPDDIFNWAAVPTLIILMIEAIVVGFLLIRRQSTEISTRWSEWLIALSGTTLPLLASPASGAPLLPTTLCISIMLAGMGLNFWAKFTLRRSFGVIAANRGVKADGPYRFLRHPMYAGYLITHIGFILSGPTLWNILVYGLTLACQIYRIGSEERILARDSAYQQVMDRVRYRLVPGLY